MSILATKNSCWAAWYYENSYVFCRRGKYYFLIIGFDSFLLMFNRRDQADSDTGSSSSAVLRSTRQRQQDMWQKPRVPCEGQPADSSLSLKTGWITENNKANLLQIVFTNGWIRIQKHRSFTWASSFPPSKSFWDIRFIYGRIKNIN